MLVHNHRADDAMWALSVAAPLARSPVPDVLQDLLDGVSPPAQAMDVSMLDGYLCGVLLQPSRPAEAAWWPLVLDCRDPDAPIVGTVRPAAALRTAVLARLAYLDGAIERRDWFDPWIYELDGEDDPGHAVLPWVGGFALAMEVFPDLLAGAPREVVEAAAAIYLHFDPEDLEDADELAEAVAELEPPQDLARAVEGLVCAVLLLADYSRPRGRRPR